VLRALIEKARTRRIKGFASFFKKKSLFYFFFF